VTVKLINRGTRGEYLLEGRLDSNSAPSVEKLILTSCGEFEQIVLNLELLQYISSAGLRIIKKLYMETSKRGTQLIAINVSDSVMEVFEMTGFSQILIFE